jgi:hypothetical protein
VWCESAHESPDQQCNAGTNCERLQQAQGCYGCEAVSTILVINLRHEHWESRTVSEEQTARDRVARCMNIRGLSPEGGANEFLTTMKGLQNFLVASLGLAIADRRAPPSSSQARSLAGQDFMKGKAMVWRAGARGGRTGGGPGSKRNHGEGADPQPSKRRDRSENAFSFMRTAIGGFDCNFDLPTDSSRSRRESRVTQVYSLVCALVRGAVEV